MSWGNCKKPEKYAKWGKAPAKALHSSWAIKSTMAKKSSVLQRERDREVIKFSF